MNRLERLNEIQPERSGPYTCPQIAGEGTRGQQVRGGGGGGMFVLPLELSVFSRGKKQSKNEKLSMSAKDYG